MGLSAFSIFSLFLISFPPCPKPGADQHGYACVGNPCDNIYDVMVSQIYSGEYKGYCNGKIDQEERAFVFKGEPQGDQDCLGVPAGKAVTLVS